MCYLLKFGEHKMQYNEKIKKLIASSCEISPKLTVGEFAKIVKILKGK